MRKLSPARIALTNAINNAIAAGGYIFVNEPQAMTYQDAYTNGVQAFKDWMYGDTFAPTHCPKTYSQKEADMWKAGWCYALRLDGEGIVCE